MVASSWGDKRRVDNKGATQRDFQADEPVLYPEDGKDTHFTSWCDSVFISSFAKWLLLWTERQIFSSPFPSAQKTSYYNALFSFCHNNKSFFESITRKLISGVISWSSNFWIYIFLICQPLLARQVAGMLIPGDFTVTLLRLMQVELQITFNRMHLLRSIIESGSQRTGGNFKNN